MRLEDLWEAPVTERSIIQSYAKGIVYQLPGTYFVIQRQETCSRECEPIMCFSHPVFAVRVVDHKTSDYTIITSMPACTWTLNDDGTLGTASPNAADVQEAASETSDARAKHWAGPFYGTAKKPDLPWPNTLNFSRIDGVRLRRPDPHDETVLRIQALNYNVLLPGQDYTKWL